MKVFTVILTLFLLTLTARGQSETSTLGYDHIGSVGGPVVRYSTIAGKGALLLGNYGGTRIGKHLALGGGGFSLLKIFDNPVPISFGYGGGFVQYNNMIGRDLYYSGDLMIGGGAGQVGTESTGLFVAEATAQFGIELLPFFRLGVGGGYRYTLTGPLPGMESDAFSGPHIGLHMIFGSF